MPPNPHCFYWVLHPQEPHLELKPHLEKYCAILISEAALPNILKHILPMADSKCTRLTTERPFTTFASFFWCLHKICFFFCFPFLEKLKIPHQTVWYVSFSESRTWLKSPSRQYKASTPVHIHEGRGITDTFSYGSKSPPVCEETTGTFQTFGAFSWSESSLCVLLLVVWGSFHGLDWCLLDWGVGGHTERQD